MTELKGYYQNGVIKIDDNQNLKDGQEVTIVINQKSPKSNLLERVRKYKGTMKVYGSTEAIQEYLKDCRSE